MWPLALVLAQCVGEKFGFSAERLAAEHHLSDSAGNV
jgi:hypothetical protein